MRGLRGGEYNHMIIVYIRSYKKAAPFLFRKSRGGRSADSRREAAAAAKPTANFRRKFALRPPAPGQLKKKEQLRRIGRQRLAGRININIHCRGWRGNGIKMTV